MDLLNSTVMFTMRTVQDLVKKKVMSHSLIQAFSQKAMKHTFSQDSAVRATSQDMVLCSLFLIKICLQSRRLLSLLLLAISTHREQALRDTLSLKLHQLEK